MKTAAFSASASGYRKEQYMLNVGKIEEGFVLDHIKAGNAMKIYHYLGLDKPRTREATRWARKIF